MTDAMEDAARAMDAQKLKEMGWTPERIASALKLVKTPSTKSLAMAQAAIPAYLASKATETGGAWWLIYSREHNMFWGPNRCGYTSDIAQAGRYTKDDADKLCGMRDPQPDGTPSEIAVIAPEAAAVILALTARVERMDAALRKIEPLVAMEISRGGGLFADADLAQIDAALKES